MKNFAHLMMTSVMFYESALELCDVKSGDKEREDAYIELLRRLGNVNNELGLKYMFWAQEEYVRVTTEAGTLSNNIYYS